MGDLSNLATHLAYITNNSASLQHKLTNPVISNSLPLKSSLHTPLINITNLLAEVSTNSDTAAAASEWISNQNWSEATNRLDLGQQHTEKLAARLRSAAFKIQTFRENLEKLKSIIHTNITKLQFTIEKEEILNISNISNDLDETLVESNLLVQDINLLIINTIALRTANFENRVLDIVRVQPLPWSIGPTTRH